jgi:ribosomal protein S18 acetylase RimI-like enzyme
MVAIRKVNANTNTQRLFSFFDANSQNATHARAVIAEGNAELWIAEDEGQVVGALLGRQMRSSDGELLGGVDNLLVDARHRRRGIGRRLMGEAEAHYRTEGLDGMQLAVNADNIVARSLYDSMGYQVVKQYIRSRHDSAGKETAEHRLRMWKPFGPGAPS